jgi:hypothetical protein
MLEPTSGRDVTRAVGTGNWKRKRVEYLAGRVIVKLKVPDEARASAFDAKAALDATCGDIVANLDGARILRPVSSTGRIVVEVPKDTAVPSVARDLDKRADVEYAEPDLIDHAAIVPNDTRYGDQWSHGVVGAEAAWDLETGGAGAAIGIIDSGISISGGVADHPDLSGSRIVFGTDFVDGGTPMDTNGHGTHVAGIAAGLGNNAAGIAGMNWGAPVYVCRTLDVNGNGSSADLADAIEEMVDWAVAAGIKIVINYSAGGGDNQTKRDAAQYASDNGMLLCAATGNDFGGAVLFPAAYSTTIPGVIAVGSTTTTDTVSQFSNVGPEVTVVAPGGEMTPAGVVPTGEAILSTFPTYAVTIPGGPNFAGLVGTSMATPLVSGLAALVWNRHPSFTNQKVKDCLTDTAVKLGSGNFNNSWGFGRVDAEAALRCGDLVLPPSRFGPICPSVFGPTCPDTRIWKWCGIETTIKPCRIESAIEPCIIKSNFVVCEPSQLIVCIPSRFTLCPTPLPRLCPTSRFTPDCQSEIDLCPSVVTECGPVTELVACGPESRFGCPSEIDACPSTFGCPFEEVFPEDPIIRQPGRFARPELRAELRRRATGASAERWQDEGGRYYYRDAAGRYHMWDPSTGGQSPGNT